MQTLSQGSTMTHSTLSSIVPAVQRFPAIAEYTLVTQTVEDWEIGESWNNFWGWGWKPDGTKFVTVTNSNDRYYGFDFATPFDFNTTSHNSANPGQSAVVVGLDMMFNEDGTKYTRWSWYSANALDAYIAATPYEPKTTDTLIGTINLGTIVGSGDAYGYWIDRSGTHIILHTQLDTPSKFMRLEMSTPWDPSTAVLQADEFLTPSIPNCGRMLMSQFGYDLMMTFGTTIYHYRLTVPYDLDTMSYYSQLATGHTGGNQSAIWMDDTGTKLIVGPGSNGSYDIQVRERPLAFAPTNAVVDYHKTTSLSEDFVLTLPANVAGDLICVFSFADGYTEARSPDFSTCTRQGALNSSAGTDVGLDLWTRTSTGGETTITGTSETSAVNRGVTMIFTLPAGTWNTGTIMDTPPLDNTHNNYDSNTVVGNPPAITTVTNGALVVTTWQISDEEATATSPPTGYTFILDALLSDEPATSSPQMAAAYKIVETAGVEDPGVWANTGDPTVDDSQSCVWAFRPA